MEYKVRHPISYNLNSLLVNSFHVASCSCGDEPAFAPFVGDCSTLANSMVVISQIVGQTFVAEAGGFELLSFQVSICTYASSMNKSRE